MTLLGEEDLGEVGRDGKFHKRGAGLQRRHCRPRIRQLRRLSAGHEIGVQHALRDIADREEFHCAAHLTAGVAGLQTPGKDNRKQGSGNDAELPQLRNGTGQPPAGNGDAHPALNDDWF